MLTRLITVLATALGLALLGGAAAQAATSGCIQKTSRCAIVAPASHAQPDGQCRC
jgi:hypothetical protein